VGDFVDGDDELGFELTTYNAAGTKLWSAKRVISFKGIDSFMATGSYGEIGDTNGDGANEIGYSLKLMGDSAKRADEGTIDGRTGKVRRDPVSGMFATRLAFDGNGSDGYRIDNKKPNVLHATAYRGHDSKVLWDVTMAVKGMPNTVATALYAGRDKCADLAVGVSNAGTFTTYVLSGATGRPLWALTRSGDGAGKVTHPSARSAKTFSRSC